jgi:hypothetical protein
MDDEGLKRRRARALQSEREDSIYNQQRRLKYFVFGNAFYDAGLALPPIGLIDIPFTGAISRRRTKCDLDWR